MDVTTLREILSSAHLKGAFQAFLITATRRGETVQELAKQVGVSRATMYRYLAKIKAERRHSPHVEIHDKPAGDASPCRHTKVFFLGRKRVCLECLASNLEDELRRERLNSKAEEQREKAPPAKFKAKGSKGAA